MISVNRKLNLVVELWRGEGVPSLFAHSTALPTQIVEQYFDLCGPAMNALLVGGYGYTAPRYASLVFRQVALNSIGPETEDKESYRRMKAVVEMRIKAFYDELHRLTSVLAIKDGKWGMVPIHEAVAADAISNEELSHIDASLVFFTCGSQSVPARSREAMLGGLALFDARLESLSCTEFVNFLQTSTKDGNSGASQDASAPSSAGSQETDSHNSSRVSMRTNSHTARRAATGFGITLNSVPPSAP